ncbi:MAG: Bbp16 family capsid cement protein [Brachymonas sp.]
MIIDKLLQVSSKQAVTASAASTDVIDFGQANPNTGMDDRSHMVITVDEAAAASGAATVKFSVQDSADNSTFADVVATSAIGKAALGAGQQVVLPMPTKLRRYCRVNYTVDTGPLTAGKFSAQVVAGFQQNTHYPDSPRIA